jgi:serine phosphatase RsbU (regulator of sigma subunit)
MEPGPTTPSELVEALQLQGNGARRHLWQQLEAPLRRLMDQLTARHQINGDRERLATNALHAAETWLRTRPTGAFAGMTWGAFRAAVLLHVAKVAAQPFGRSSAGAAEPLPLPRSPLYDSETLFLPHDRVGDYFFGGDWYGGGEAGDGSLWVIVADITGHGYHAYLLASALPGVWQRCWETAPRQPADLLAAMHHLVADCLPEGVYVECTLVRLAPEGEAVVAAAGGSRLILRRGHGRPDLLKLRGAWLGLSAPSAAEQKTWTLQNDDELLLATDGVFDQLAVHDEGMVLEQLASAPLLAGVRKMLDRALQRAPQADDITLVLLRRRPSPTPAAGSLATSTPGEAGHV